LTGNPPGRIALAVNPTSGRGRGRRAGQAAVERLRAGGAQVEVLIGADADDLRGQIEQAVRSGIGALVMVGGDGMVHLGVTQVASSGIPLGIIPAGTGNDVARALELPLADPQAAADVVLGGQQRVIDAVRCTAGARPGAVPDREIPSPAPAPEPTWFAGVLGAGFDALVNERANQWTRPRGSSRYVLAMLRELPVFRPRDYTLVLDGERLETAAMLVAVANTPSYGGGMRVCPEAVPDDGLLDVMVVEPMSRARFLAIFPRVYAGTHVSDPRVVIRRARTVALDAPGIVAYADGERIGPLPLTCEVGPGSVRILAARAAVSPGR
jgi:diacylglycerol kinase (ATP)